MNIATVHNENAKQFRIGITSFPIAVSSVCILNIQL